MMMTLQVGPQSVIFTYLTQVSIKCFTFRAWQGREAVSTRRVYVIDHFGEMEYTDISKKMKQNKKRL